MAWECCDRRAMPGAAAIVFCLRDGLSTARMTACKRGSRQDTLRRVRPTFVESDSDSCRRGSLVPGERLRLSP